MVDSRLAREFDKCLRYQRAKSWQKPFLSPARFLRNRFWFGAGRPRKVGQPRWVRAFHLPRFKIVNGETVSGGIAAYGIFEPELTGAFLRLMEPCWVVVDVGMHLGYYTTLFASLVGPRGFVHAFEPTPSTREIASANVGQFKNVRVHPLAAWSSAQKLTFHDYGPLWMAFNSFTAARMKNGPPPPREFAVETIALDAFRAQLDRKISLIKIDAESAEEEILKGAQHLLQSDRPLISLEVGDAEGETTSRRLIEILQQSGYAPWEFSENRFSAHQAREHYEYDNLIFAPKTVDLSDK